MDRGGHPAIFLECQLNITNRDIRIHVPLLCPTLCIVTFLCFRVFVFDPCVLNAPPAPLSSVECYTGLDVSVLLWMSAHTNEQEARSATHVHMDTYADAWVYVQNRKGCTSLGGGVRVSHQWSLRKEAPELQPVHLPSPGPLQPPPSTLQACPRLPHLIFVLRLHLHVREGIADAHEGVSLHPTSAHDSPSCRPKGGRRYLCFQLWRDSKRSGL